MRFAVLALLIAGCSGTSDPATDADAGPSTDGLADAGVDRGRGSSDTAADAQGSLGSQPRADGGAGCSGSALAVGDTTRTLTVGTLTRTYHLHVPAGLPPGQPAPLLLAFHGGGHTAQGYEDFAHLKAKADEAKFVLVQPEGVGAIGPTADGIAEVWNAGNCCLEASTLKKNVDDVGFTRAILADVKGVTCIDPKRIFSTGFSNGGMFSYRLACELSDQIAAIASVGGGSGATNNDVTPPAPLFACKPSRKMPVLEIHGTEDACYPIDGGLGSLSGVTFEPVHTTIDGWVARNGCGQTSTRAYTNGAAKCQRYDCPAPGDVTFCTIEGAGHYWPGGDDWPGSEFLCGLNQGVRSADVHGNDFIWDYFKAHPMP